MYRQGKFAFMHLSNLQQQEQKKQEKQSSV